MGLAASISDDVNLGVTSGAWTVLLHHKNLGGASNQSGVRTSVYTGAALAGTPLWNGADAWPVAQEGLVNSGDIESSKLKFSASYVAGGVWVGRSETGVLQIDLPFSGLRLLLNITHPVITANISNQGAVRDGVIAGVLGAEDFIEEFRTVLGTFDSSLCSGSTFDSFAQQLRAASDILADGTNASGPPCDGISIGLGFTAKPVIRGAVAAPNPHVDTCP